MTVTCGYANINETRGEVECLNGNVSCSLAFGPLARKPRQMKQKAWRQLSEANHVKQTFRKGRLVPSVIKDKFWTVDLSKASALVLMLTI